MVTKEQLQHAVTEISASVAAAEHVERVECVRCDVLSFHAAIAKYSAEVVTVLKGLNKLDYTRYAEDWIGKFSKYIYKDTSWVIGDWLPVRKQAPAGIISYKCHHKTIKRLYNKEYERIQKLLGTLKKCKSDIIFRFNHMQNKKQFKIIIEINNSYCERVHIHNYFLTLASADTSLMQQYLSGVTVPSPDLSYPLLKIDEIYYRYFADGHTLQTAKMFHLLKLLSKYDDNKNVLSDQTKNPITFYVQRLWKHFSSYVQDQEDRGVNFALSMSRKRAEMEKRGGLISYSSQDTVTIITPTMRRVLSSHELDEVIISSTEVSQGPAVTLFYIPSKIGALCFACVLHQKKVYVTEYANVFSTAKTEIEKINTKKFEPTTVIVDISPFDIAKLAVKSVFPKSKVLIAPWSLCCQTWTWLRSTEESNKSYWHEAMVGFHDIMYAANRELAHSKIMKLMLKWDSKGFESYKLYLDQIWKEYRPVIWWSKANNTLVGLSIRLLQQLFIKKCASFNIINMCDIIDILDKHFKDILLCLVNKKQPLLKLYLKFLDKYELNVLKIEIISPSKFTIESGYKLRSDTWCCDCYCGRRALYCKHLCTFMSLAEVTVELDEHERRLLLHMAGEVEASADADDSCSCEDATKACPTYTDGYYLFHFPMDINISFTCEGKPIELNLLTSNCSNLIINESIEAYKSKSVRCFGVLPEEDYYIKDKDMKVIVKRLLDGFDRSVASMGHIHCGSKMCYKKKQTHTTEQIEETMDTENINQAKGSLKYSATGTHSKEIFNGELDLKFEPMEYTEDEEGKSSADINETEYKNALDNLRAEFSKFRDKLLLSPCTRKMECIDRLTKQFSETRVEILGVKSE